MLVVGQLLPLLLDLRLQLSSPYLHLRSGPLVCLLRLAGSPLLHLHQLADHLLLPLQLLQLRGLPVDLTHRLPSHLVHFSQSTPQFLGALLQLVESSPVLLGFASEGYRVLLALLAHLVRHMTLIEGDAVSQFVLLGVSLACHRLYLTLPYPQLSVEHLV